MPAIKKEYEKYLELMMKSEPLPCPECEDVGHVREIKTGWAVECACAEQHGATRADAIQNWNGSIIGEAMKAEPSAPGPDAENDDEQRSEFLPVDVMVKAASEFIEESRMRRRQPPKREFYWPLWTDQRAAFEKWIEHTPIESLSPIDVAFTGWQFAIHWLHEWLDNSPYWHRAQGFSIGGEPLPDTPGPDVSFEIPEDDEEAPQGAFIVPDHIEFGPRSFALDVDMVNGERVRYVSDAKVTVNPGDRLSFRIDDDHLVVAVEKPEPSDDEKVMDLYRMAVEKGNIKNFGGQGPDLSGGLSDPEASLDKLFKHMDELRQVVKAERLRRAMKGEGI